MRGGGNRPLIPNAFDACVFCSFLIQAPNPSAPTTPNLETLIPKTDPGYCSATKRGAGWPWLRMGQQVLFPDPCWGGVSVIRDGAKGSGVRGGTARPLTPRCLCRLGVDASTRILPSPFLKTKAIIYELGAW
jgi:hypothetical protein